MIIESLANKEIETDRKKWLICCFALLVINPSLSSYFYLLIDIVLIYTIRLRGSDNVYKYKVIKRTLITCTVIIVIVGFFSINAQTLVASSNYFLHRLGNLFVQFNNITTNNELLLSSESIRMSGIVYAFSMWLKRPLFGFGIGSIACISGIFTFLVGGGIICLILYFDVLVKFSQVKKTNLSSIIIFLFTIFIVPNLFLNEYETIMCIVIPLASYEYSLILNDKQEIDKSNLVWR